MSERFKPRLPVPDSAPRVLDMRGNGYPAQLMGMNDDWRDVLIEHYNRVWVSGGDGRALRLEAITPPLHAGDQVIFGDDALSSRTYWVLWSVTHKEKPGAFMARLEALPPPPVWVMGERFPP